LKHLGSVWSFCFVNVSDHTFLPRIPAYIYERKLKSWRLTLVRLQARLNFDIRRLVTLRFRYAVICFLPACLLRLLALMSLVDAPCCLLQEPFLVLLFKLLLWKLLRSVSNISNWSWRNDFEAGEFCRNFIVVAECRSLTTWWIWISWLVTFKAGQGNRRLFLIPIWSAHSKVLLIKFWIGGWNLMLRLNMHGVAGLYFCGLKLTLTRLD
jgi:hypothetical protein